MSVRVLLPDDQAAERDRVLRQLRQIGIEAEVVSTSNDDVTQIDLATLQRDIQPYLSGILSLVERLTRTAHEDQPGQNAELEATGTRLLQNLTIFMDLMEIASEATTFQAASFDLRDALQDAVDNVLSPFNGHAPDPVVTQPSAPVPVQIDQAAVTCVAQFLLTHTLTYTDDVRVSLESAAGEASIRVAGSGHHAASPDEHPVHASDSASGQPRGLGMAIAQHVVDRLGGRLTVERASDRDWATTVTLPQEPAHPEPASAPEAAQPVPPSARPRLLIVEDNKSTRWVLKRMLQDTYRVDEAASIAEALAKADAAAENGAPYTGFLLDINLGVLGTGVDLLHDLRKRSAYRSAPAVACTAYDTTAHRTKFLEAGFDGYVSKPFTKVTLLEAVTAVIDPTASPERADADAEQTTATTSAKPPKPESSAANKLDLRIPPLPESVPEIIDVLSGAHEGPDVERLQRILRNDPVLASWVLAHVNSAYFGLSSKVSDLSRAVMLLGVKPVCNLLLMKMLSQVFADLATPAARQVYKYLLALSVATGAVAKDLADHLEAADPELAFTTGLLHQVGRLVLLSNDPHTYPSLWDDDARHRGAPPLRTERAHYDMDSAEVGVLLVKQWALPKELGAVMRHYGQPDRISQPPLRRLATVTAAGLAVAEALLTAEEQDGNELSPAALDLLDRLASVQDTSPSSLRAFVESRLDPIRELTDRTV